MQTVHVITPGDHFSPLTGSAIPTVVHGLAQGRPPGQPRPRVAVAQGTNPVRYDSADVIEYPPVRDVRMPFGVTATQFDAGASRLRIPRLLTRRRLRPVLQNQDAWPPSRIVAHNAPQLVPLAQTSRHIPYLYAHNDVLKTYSQSEAGRTLNAAAGIICVSNYLAGRTASRLPAALRDRIRVVHNAVDTEYFTRLAPLRHSGGLRVLFVGRMIPEKGADVLLQAVKKLRRTDIQVTLIGSRGFDVNDPLSPFESSVHALAAELEQVSIEPFRPRDHVRDAMGRADVVVVPSRWPEPFALTVLEGMASGAAVVGSDVGGIPETVADVGMLVPPEDPAALAQALEALADDRDLLGHTAAAGRAYAETHTWRHAARALHKITEELG